MQVAERRSSIQASARSASGRCVLFERQFWCESPRYNFVESARGCVQHDTHNASSRSQIRNVPGVGVRRRRKAETRLPSRETAQRMRARENLLPLPSVAKSAIGGTQPHVPCTLSATKPWHALTLTPLFFVPVCYTRGLAVARDVQAGSDGQRQGLPTLVANGGGTD